MKQVIAPGAARRYAHRRWQFDSRRVRSLHVAKLQAASVPIALGQLRYGRDGRIAVSLKRPGVAGLKLGLDCAKL